MSRDSRSALALSAVLLFAALAAPGAVAAADGPATTTDAAPEESSAFVVELDADGDATVTLVLTYDLADGDDEAAFEALRDRPEEVTARFDDRMSRIADRTAAETDREMSVSDVRPTSNRPTEPVSSGSRRRGRTWPRSRVTASS